MQRIRSVVEEGILIEKKISLGLYECLPLPIGSILEEGIECKESLEHLPYGSSKGLCYKNDNSIKNRNSNNSIINNNNSNDNKEERNDSIIIKDGVTNQPPLSRNTSDACVKKWKILIVDDSRFNRRMLSKYV